MLLSVVIPTHRSPSRILKHLHDQFQDRRGDVEVIILQDGGGRAEKCGPSCEGLSVIYRSIQESSPLGPGALRNMGMTVATGRYITFVDDDDEIAAQELELLDCLSEAPQDVIIAEFNHPNRSFERKFYNPLEEISTESIFKKFREEQKTINHCTGIFFARDFLQRTALRFPDTFIVEDFQFVTETFLRASSIATTCKFRYIYIPQPNTTKNIISPRNFFCTLTVYRNLSKLRSLKAQAPSAAYLSDRQTFIYQLLLARAPALFLTCPSSPFALLGAIILMLRLIKFDLTRTGYESVLIAFWALAVFHQKLRLHVNQLRGDSMVFLYCAGALSDLWMRAFMMCGVKNVFCADDGEFRGPMELSLQDVVERIQNVHEEPAAVIVMSLDTRTCEAIINRLTSALGATSQKVSIYSLPLILTGISARPICELNSHMG